MKILEKIKEFLSHFLKRILQITLSFVAVTVCCFIYLITYEPNTKCRVTVRKAKRIRLLSKFKLYMYKWFKPMFEFMDYEYMHNFYNKFSFLINSK